MGDAGSSSPRRKLDQEVPRRVKAYLDEVCEFDDPRSHGKGFSGDLAGYWRYRIGDYRILVEVRQAELIIVAITLGHRSGIYQGNRVARSQTSSR